VTGSVSPRSVSHTARSNVNQALAAAPYPVKYLHTLLTSINAGLSSLKLLEPKQMTWTCGNAASRFINITVNSVDTAARYKPRSSPEGIAPLFLNFRHWMVVSG